MYILRIISKHNTYLYDVYRYADSGQSNSLVVEEEGEGEAGDNGGLEAMVTEFNSGRWLQSLGVLYSLLLSAVSRYQYGLAGIKSAGKGVKV